MARFDDKVVLITGAATGIGRATAARLASEGASLFLLDLNREGLSSSAKEAGEQGPGDVVTRIVDVSDEAAVLGGVAACIERFGKLDTLCNIAGIIHWDHFHDHPLDDWNRVIAVNLTGTFLMCRTVIPHLLETKGSIVNISSTAALSGHAWAAAYTASKGGVHSLTKLIAVEYGKQGVRTNAICPGGIDTPMSGTFTLPEDADPSLVNRIMSLTGSSPPETLASVIAFLASDDAAHINGEYIRVDGAMLS